MGFLKRWRKPWQNKRDCNSNTNRKEYHLIYGWVSLKIPASQRCPYVYVFRIVPIPNGNAIPSGFAKGRVLHEFVHKNLLWNNSPYSRLDRANQDLIRAWDQIIPSAARLPTHRVEMGIVRKGNNAPRSIFFRESFCFLTLDGKDPDKAAIRIAGFLTTRLNEVKSFQGEALDRNKAYWLAAILAAWRRLN